MESKALIENENICSDMNTLRKIRTQHRRLFTKACNEFDKEEGNLDNESKLAKLKVIEEKAFVLIESERKTREQLYLDDIEESVLEIEIDESEAYIDRWRSLEHKLKQLSLHEKEDSVSSSDVTQKNTLLRYPKIQLPSFNGDIRNWLSFWGQFQKIDKDPNLDLHDKFSYLSQAMVKGSIAEDLVKSFPPGGNSYEKAVNQIKNRFGKEELLIQIYVRDLLGLVLQKESSQKKSLRVLYDLLESKLRALEILGVTRDKYASMLLPLIESALPEETLRAWERYRSTNRRSREVNIENEQSIDITEKNDLSSILEFVQDEVESEERIILASQTFDCSKTGFNMRKENRPCSDKRTVNSKLKFGNAAQVPTTADLLTSSREQRQCLFCSNFHNSAACMKARKIPLKERECLVEKSRCCFLCLKPGHGVRRCNVRANCLSCGKRHHILLCRNIQSKPPSSTSENIVNSEENPVKDSTLANVSKSPSVMLQTLMVIVRGNGKKRRARAIIDSASQRSYILKKTAREMQYERVSKEKLCHSLFGGTCTDVIDHDVFTVFLSKTNGSYNCNFKALGQDLICESLPPVCQGKLMEELKEYNIHLDDENNGPIEILIGADIAGKLMTGGFRLLESGLAAIETLLGWTVMGKTANSEISNNSALLVTSMLNKETMISDLWALDTLGILDPSEKKNELELHEAAREHFLSTVKVNKEGRFQVSLPWLEGHLPLPDNLDSAVKRLESTTKRLRAEKLYEAYGEVFNSWERVGIIEEVPKNEIESPCHYLPHRHVVKENSTTRIRPVFDASSKRKGAPSLNDCLEKGLNIIELIPSILHRFRMKRIGVSADIRQAFLQISLHHRDKDYLRFLWYDDEGKLKYYRHRRVVFGVSSSPFLLGSVIQYHLDATLEAVLEGKSQYPVEIIKQLKNSFYVDNCLTSVKTELELQPFIEVSKNVLAERKFDLRGWEYTCTTEELSTTTSVLGMHWKRDSDSLSLNITNIIQDVPDKITKRNILAVAHKIYDPLGITSPVTLFPKLLLQILWKSKLSWDQEVDSKTKSEFRTWMNGLNYLRQLEIPRWLHCDLERKNLSLHFFCDASKLAYSTAAFIRVETEASVHVQLLQAKSRIAPSGKKETTIARLELLGATICARLASTILKEFQTDDIYFWTDSSTVLAWIQRNEVWDVFVHNRIQEIKQLTPKECWRHVPGVMNPADLPSRGCSARHLIASNWWEGPEWLYLSKGKWPNNSMNPDEEEVAKEKKKIIVSSLNLNSSNLVSNRFSSYQKTIRLMAWIFRFLRNCKEKIKMRGDLTVREMKEAERTIVCLIQRESFTVKEDKRLKTLDTFLDDGIIRLKTTVFRRDDHTEFRMPAVLPGEHPLVKSLVLEEHKKRGHAGVSHTLNSLREKYWILCGRRTVKSVIRSCVICKRYSTKNNNPPTAPPPADRVQDANVFQVTGIDFAGPVILRDSTKAWISLFTCAVYRAVHLELVSSLSTEAFLLAFHRFVARRGKPSIIYSDNGTNFTGAANALASIDFDAVSKRAREEQIIWKFIPPGAPWWGGWWERLVGMMKTILKKTLGRTSLNYEEMTTALCSCEAILNDRPLTTVTSDPSLVALSPADFLKEIKSNTLPDIKTNPDPNHLRRLRYIQTIREAFRARFRQEYLGALCVKQKNRDFSPVKQGDIVLVRDDDKKRQSWPLGRIIEVLPGADGIIRRVRVKTQSGELIRAVQKIYPLELSSNEVLPPPVRKEKEMEVTRAPPIDTFPNGENIKLNETPECQKSRAGRTLKRPKRLDL